MDRRTFVHGVGAVAVATSLAGCGEEDEPESEPEPESEEGKAFFEITDTDDGISLLSTDEQEIGGVVENTGDATGEQQVAIVDGNGDVIDASEVELEPKETFAATLTYEPNAFEPGKYQVGITTEDDIEVFSFTVDGDEPSKEDIELLEHELVIVGGSGDFITDVYIKGLVANNSHTKADYAEIAARIYDPDGNQVDSYSDNTADLAANTNWAFEIMVVEDPEDVDEYDIAVEDIRF